VQEAWDRVGRTLLSANRRQPIENGKPSPFSIPGIQAET
jgi:hypothetical protein